ncbi:MAG: FHA domain-containing protein [Gammaproteobacteria bacterium]|nr:FHA domain-containing protein [Gammaproteobacteria bacterium]
MAYLVSNDSQSRCYLSAYHKFGRLQHTADTLINCSNISKLHAIIEWTQGAWYIWDVSTNGTWLNGEKLIAKTRYILNINDQIVFPGTSRPSFVVEDLAPPQDLLLPLLAGTTAVDPAVEAIKLEKYHLLPSEVSPEYAIFYDEVNANWHCESVFDNANNALTDGDIIEFSGMKWRVHLGNHLALANTVQEIDSDIEQYTFTFYLSLDEEKTQLRLESQNMQIDLDIRNHHYLTLLLARYRAADIKKGIDGYNQGWVEVEQLSQDLGIDQLHINIQIHRARKQLVDSLEQGIIFDDLIQRKKGSIRLGCNQFTIYKGKELEFRQQA